jgi:hypothetical protein
VTREVDDVKNHWDEELLTESVVLDPALRRRAESVAVLSWRLVCSCMILGHC